MAFEQKQLAPLVINQSQLSYDLGIKRRIFHTGSTPDHAPNNTSLVPNMGTIKVKTINTVASNVIISLERYLRMTGIM